MCIYIVHTHTHTHTFIHDIIGTIIAFVKGIFQFICEHIGWHSVIAT